MKSDPAYDKGQRVMYRGIIAEVIEVLIADRYEPAERYQYRIETAGGNLLRIDEDDLQPYQPSFF